MRSGLRKITREPIRSPSPDIANKNIIANTKAPVAEILKKSRVTLMQGVNSIEDLQRAVIDWEEKYRIIQRQLNNMMLENSALKTQISKLRELLANNKPVFVQQSQDRQEIGLRQYEARIARLMEEIRRIQELLQRQKEKSQFLENENGQIKSAQANLKNLNYVEETLNLSLERMKAEHQLKARLTFNGLSERMSKIEKSQLTIENLICKSEFRTPKVSKQREANLSTTPGYRSSSPSDSKKFARKSIPQQQVRDAVLQELSLENSRLKQALQKQKRKSFQKEEVIECLTCKIYQRKLSDFQAQLQKIRNQKEEGSYNREMALKGQLDRQHESFAFNLQDYLRRIREVKTILNNEQFREFVEKVNDLINQNTKLQGKIDSFISQRDRLERQYKSKEIQLKISVNEMKKQNEVLKTQVKEQDTQIRKLQQIIQIHLKSQEKTVQLPSFAQGEQNQSDPKIFQRYIQQAIRKLQSLEQSIETTLRE